MITAAQALSMPRFEFIAHWLVVLTRKKENLGPLGIRVRHAAKTYSVVSPIGGGTVVYATKDPALLFDYVRRTQLGPLVRDADEFRVLAHEQDSGRGRHAWPVAQASADATPADLERDIKALVGDQAKGDR
jgi:hypothetical protein